MILTRFGLPAAACIEQPNRTAAPTASNRPDYRMAMLPLPVPFVIVRPCTTRILPQPWEKVLESGSPKAITSPSAAPYGRWTAARTGLPIPGPGLPAEPGHFRLWVRHPHGTCTGYGPFPLPRRGVLCLAAVKKSCIMRVDPRGSDLKFAASAAWLANRTLEFVRDPGFRKSG